MQPLDTRLSMDLGSRLAERDPKPSRGQDPGFRSTGGRGLHEGSASCWRSRVPARDSLDLRRSWSPVRDRARTLDRDQARPMPVT